MNFPSYAATLWIRERRRDTEREKQTEKQTERQRDRQRQTETDRETDWQRETNREAGKETKRQAERQRERQADWPTERQAGRQADWPTDTETHRDREKETNINKRPQRKTDKSHLGRSRSLLDVLQQVVEGARDGRGGAAQVLQKAVLVAGGLRCGDDALHRLGHQLGCFYQLLLAGGLTNGRCHNLRRNQATL